MRSWFAQLKLKLALWLIGEAATVVPAATLAKAEAELVGLIDYVALHSGRLNDGTTRNVRRKLRNRLQDALGLVDGCYDIERSVGIESRVRRDLVPNGL